MPDRIPLFSSTLGLSVSRSADLCQICGSLSLGFSLSLSVSLLASSICGSLYLWFPHLSLWYFDLQIRSPFSLVFGFLHLSAIPVSRPPT